MPISDYISELLYEHDCVVIPGFGAFIGNYSPAKVDDTKHLFTPPFKRLIFNSLLLANDGLLANHIAEKENISYTSALKRAMDEGIHYQSVLKKEKMLSFHNIGELYYDERQKLLFRQDETINYLPEATGLVPFYRLPAERVASKPTQGNSMRKPMPRIIPYSIAATVAVLITFNFWFSIFEKGSHSYSGFNLLLKSTPRKYFATYDVAADTLNVNKIPPPLRVEPKLPTDTEYSIVTGCFAIQQNTGIMIAQLQKKGINASVIGKRYGKLWMVGFGKFDTKASAEARLDEYRKEQRDAWLIEKRKLL